MGEPRADWKLARRLALLAACSPGHAIRRADACRELGLTTLELWPRALGPAYGSRLVDVVGDWVVAPALLAPDRPRHVQGVLREA